MMILKKIVILFAMIKFSYSLKINHYASEGVKNSTKFIYFVQNRNQIENDISLNNDLKRSLHKNKTNENNNLQFMLSKFKIDSDAEPIQTSKSRSTVPIIFPARALITLPSDKAEKTKKNFSKLAKNLIINPIKLKEKSTSKEEIKSTKIIKLTTSKITLSTTTSDMNNFCSDKNDGLYDDPIECETFVICFANRTFRTKCAYGTLWNHIRKECDYPEKVDCERLTTTMEPSTTTTQTTKKPSTILIKPKLSFITKKPIQKAKDEPEYYTLSNNVILAVIIVPGAIILILAIILTLWYWNKKFKLQNKKFEAVKHSSNLSYIKEENNKKEYENRLSSKFSSYCCCIKKLSNIASYRQQFQPKMINSSNALNKNDHVCSQPNLTDNNVNHNNITENINIDYQNSNQVNNDNNVTKVIELIETKNEEMIDNCENAITIENKGFIQETPAPIVLNECKLANNSHVTLSSHFEDNNWDYNFATRGLYLNQPWVKGHYVHTLGSESLATSAVLTLDPTTELGSEINGNKIVEICGGGGSDTDGYYA